MFNKIGQAKEDIIVVGERTLVSLYGGATEEGLDVSRYRRFCDKISKGTSHVEPRTLPPTSAAAMYHSLRVYYHVYQCRLISLRHQQNRKTLYVIVARNCATQRGAHVDNMACNAVMCVQKADVQVVATRNCLMFPMIAWTEAIARCGTSFQRSNTAV